MGNFQTVDTKQEFLQFTPTWDPIESGDWNTAETSSITITKPLLVQAHHRQENFCQNLAKFLGITYNQIFR